MQWSMSQEVMAILSAQEARNKEVMFVKQKAEEQGCREKQVHT